MWWDWCVGRSCVVGGGVVWGVGDDDCVVWGWGFVGCGCKCCVCGVDWGIVGWVELRGNCEVGWGCCCWGIV